MAITSRDVLSQTAWCMRMPAATETLKESTIPFIGILQCKSDNSRASSLIPLEAESSQSQRLIQISENYNLQENMKDKMTILRPSRLKN